MKACPYRADFFNKLGGDYFTVEKELGDWLAALQSQVTRVQTFISNHKYDKGL